jgi:ethanolamine ammonia-lyase small subunit
MMDKDQMQKLVDEILQEIAQENLKKLTEQNDVALSTNLSNAPIEISELVPDFKQPKESHVSSGSFSSLTIDLPDPTTDEMRKKPGVDHPLDSEGLPALISTTSARIGGGRAGTRLRTRSLLLFQSDLAVTQDTLYRDVDLKILAQFNLFSVQTQITEGKEQYLLRPDLGRRLNEEACKTIQAKCVKSPNIQICIGDGLSAYAIEVNLPKIFPVLEAGCKTAGLTLGTPFFIQYCRVGVMNDIGDLIQPDVLILLIGERPGLGRAESMSAYMAFRPSSGQTDADREVICNIFDGGGTNPLEAGAYAIQMAKKMIKNQASGVKSKLIE